MVTLLRRLPRLLALATALACVACDAGDAGDSGDANTHEAEGALEDEDPGTSTGGTGDPDGAAPALLLECGIDAACDVLSLPTDEALSKQRYDAEGLCVIAALSQPTPATLVQIEVATASSIAHVDLAIVDATTVLRQSYGQGADVGEWINQPMRCTLQGPEFFAACAQNYDPSCLDPESWVRECVPLEILECPTP